MGEPDHSCLVAQGLPIAERYSFNPPSGLGGGRTWWAHLKFTRINIELTILRKNVWSAPDPQAAIIGEEPSALMYSASQ